MEFSSLKIKKIPIFSQKEAFLMFCEMKLFKKTSYISGENSLSSKNKPTVKIFFIFQEMELSSPKCEKFSYFYKKNFLLFQQEICRAWKTKKKKIFL